MRKFSYNKWLALQKAKMMVLNGCSSFCSFRCAVHKSQMGIWPVYLKIKAGRGIEE